MSIQIFFGVGNLVLTRTDVAYSTPTQFGVIQDVEIDFDFTNKMLVGQNQFPVDVARGEGKIAGKAKVANIYARGVNDAFFGQTLTTAGGVVYTQNEAHTVATTTLQVTNHTGFIADQGVFYASSGVQLVQVAPGSEAAGKYSVNNTTGTYTFNVADEVALVFNYTWQSTTGASEISIANQLMGTSPVFSMLLAGTYKGNSIAIKLNAAISTKLTLPFKNTDYAIQDFEFSAYADAAGNIGTITLTQ